MTLLKNLRGVAMIYIPYVVLERLKEYRKILLNLDCEYVTSEEIAKLAGVSSDLVRRDFMYLKINGQKKKGYNRIALLTELDETFAVKRNLNIIVVGGNRLGQALVTYDGFSSCGVRVVAIFDNNPENAGKFVEDLVILSLEPDILRRVIKRFSVSIAAVCVLPKDAQRVVDLLVENGIVGIWNFTPVKLAVPENVIVVDADLTSSLLMLKRLVDTKVFQKSEASNAYTSQE
ncbi:redox-sensing transcriptional repressor Rex [Pseudothermotoga thermarum]|uniref:Redox-sensing transcriptional repressor Rex n=1 Tax=Pseudothermotoga thermarum DSM 5069 TaxID=688269 RepID=F7YU99_9THEM|nr:redox-sensing transcriptional repressor Rex [Pseudothermotoga thermarum]AEH50202.1 CoA-binding domain protein [Pseudothermotoga thermarum DSM 5069]